MSEYLYRYFNVDYHDWLKDKEWIRRLLINREIRFTDINDFNDPFDCQILLNMNNANAEEIRQFYDKHLAPLQGSPTFQQFSADPLLRNIYAEGLRRSIKLDKLVRILCLSEKCDDILMWSHYANRHRGMVVGFKKSKLKPESIVQVIYDDNYLSLSDFLNITNVPQDSQKANESSMKFYTRKSTHWRYESEFRMFNLYKKEYDTLPEGTISEVIFGWKMPNEIKADIKSIIDSNKLDIPLRQTFLSPDRYFLDIIAYPNPLYYALHGR